MSQHQAFRRVPVPQQAAQSYRTINIPAPTRGLVESENEAFMQPGGALRQDNWWPTMRGVKLRGGSRRWCDLHGADAVVPPLGDPARKPVISGFEYVFGSNRRMFAGQPTKLWDITTTSPTLVKSGTGSGNWASAQMSNASGNYLIAVNDAGDYPMRFDGSLWLTLDGAAPGADQIKNPGTGLPKTGLTYVWKYRNRLFFIEGGTMNAWYLGIDSIAGTLNIIPLSGSFSRGGRLLFGASWSIDAGDGIDDKCVFASDQGELVIFTGSNPGDAANWRQEGRYNISKPMGMNAHISIGGDLLIATVDGIVPVSQAITKTAEQLELAALTRPIKTTWREMVDGRSAYPWTMEKWDEVGLIFVTWPGGVPGKRMCGAANNVTGAWSRTVGWDAMCFTRLGADMFFGTQDGLIQQANRTGYDDATQGAGGVISGTPYVASLVGGWELFQTAGSQVVWHQSRASFTSSQEQPFVPQLDATVDYEVIIPPAPPAGIDPGLLEVWDQGLWDVARWDQPGVERAPIRNTLWVSIGKMGFSHAPIVQVTVAQQATPNVELIAIAATFERAGTNV
jgi:hypothetical protein